MDFNKLPKVELHLHLDCSLSYQVASKINPSISQQEFKENFIAPEKCKDLADFLKCTSSGIALMQSEEHLHLVVHDLFEQLVRDNVIYAEIRFAPLLHCEKGLTPEKVVSVVNDATEKACKESGIEAMLILCTLRHFTEAQSMQTVMLVDHFKGTRVVALDLAADEAGFPIDAHIKAFEYAIEKGISRTAHAGEARGADSIRETLNNFRPTRIGHGVRCLEDPALVEELKASGIHLEVCPSCNVQIDLYNEYKDHPIDRLLKAGVSVGINTDARTLTNITLTQEYQKLHEVFGWGVDDFMQCNLNAVQAAFIPEKLRKKLESCLIDRYDRF
ncbi:adenosine deaminase [bacterium]|nr:adenosine deaminase [bacterium]